MGGERATCTTRQRGMCVWRSSWFDHRLETICRDGNVPSSPRCPVCRENRSKPRETATSRPRRTFHEISTEIITVAAAFVYLFFIRFPATLPRARVYEFVLLLFFLTTVPRIVRRTWAFLCPFFRHRPPYTRMYDDGLSAEIRISPKHTAPYNTSMGNGESRGLTPSSPITCVDVFFVRFFFTFIVRYLVWPKIMEIKRSVQMRLR